MTREHWLPSAPESARTARTLVREAAAQVGLDGERVFDLTLAATEAVANAIRHGEAWPNGCILLTTEACARGLRVEVCDCGTFDSMLEPASLEATSGRGIQIIATLVDRLDVQNRNGFTRVRFEKHRLKVVPNNVERPLPEQEEEMRRAQVAG
jgi:anti-sigma regulatory factor (Ser/Thr protein kinase)